MAKLDYMDLNTIVHQCSETIQLLNGIDSAHNRIVMLVLLDLKTKIERKLCGLRKENYTLNLKPVEVQALFYLRNELHVPNMLHSRSVSLLLELNKKK